MNAQIMATFENAFGTAQILKLCETTCNIGNNFLNILGKHKTSKFVSTSYGNVEERTQRRNKF